jgi:hypothetical protein
MDRPGGIFIYESWCPACLAVTRHLNGECLVCSPPGFPRPAVVAMAVEDRVLPKQ